MSTTASTSVKVLFYNSDGTLNTDYSGVLHDRRKRVSIQLEGTNVLTATLTIDSAAATNTLNQAHIECDMNATTTVVAGSNGEDNTYPFTNNGSYALKANITLNTTGFPVLKGKFSVYGAPETESYTYLHTTDINTFSRAIVSNPNDIENGSTITIDAPFNFAINVTDTRKPVKMQFKFDVMESGSDTNNSESLNAYSPVLDYNDDTGVYNLLLNELSNNFSYAMSVYAIFADGFTAYKNVVSPINVFKAPVIMNVEAYGLGLDITGAGDSSVSSVMDVTMETESTGQFTGDTKITFKLSQGADVYYTYEVDAKSGTDPVYYITKADLKDTVSSTPTPSTTSGGKTYYQFDVTAHRTYSSDIRFVNKVSEPVAEYFTLDITSVAAVSVGNQWTVVSVVANTVTLDSELTQDKYDLIAENGIVAKFSKTAFFGTGITTGLYKDLDTTSTQFKIEASSDSGVTYAPVTSLRMKQGTAAAVDRAEYISLIDDAPITNADGLYANIPWSSTALGTAQPPIYMTADCAPADQTQNPGIFSLNGVQTKYTDADMTSVKADSTLAVSTIPNEDGWTITNGAAVNSKAPKVNLYFYKNTVSGYISASGENPSQASEQTSADSFTLSQASGLGLYAVFEQNNGAKQYPFFIAYTTPTGTDDKRSWYKSNVFFAPASGNPLNSGLTLAYSGTDDLSFYPDIPSTRRVKYNVNMGSSNANVGYLSEFVNFLSLQTSSNIASTAPGDFNFQLLETGMFTSHASTGLVSLSYNQYSRFVLKVSVVADGSTLPDATTSKSIRVMDKVNTPTAQSAYYSISTDKLYVAVDNSSSDDNMTGVLFTSNLAAPNNSKVVPKPAGNTSNVFTFEINSPERRGSASPVVFQIAHIVHDDNGGSDITGLTGPDTSVVCLNAPTKANYVISNFDYTTVNDDLVSSATFDVAFNSNNDAVIRGVRVYFSAANIEKTFVQNILNDPPSTFSVTVTLSDKSFFSTWADLAEGEIELVPIYEDVDANGDSTGPEVILDPRDTYSVFNALSAASDTVTPTLVGGIIEASTSLKWTGASGSTYSFSSGATDLSSSIVVSASGTSFSYVVPSSMLAVGVAVTFNLKKKYTVGTANTYGPLTTLTFTPVSINTSAMAISVLRGSNELQLVASHAPPTVSSSSLADITEVKLCSVSGSVATPLSFADDSVGSSTSTLQTANETNTYTLSSTLSTLLSLQAKVSAGVNYSHTIGSAATQNVTSESVVLPLGPSKAYRVAGAPTGTPTTSTYTVVGNRIVVPVSLNANGLEGEGLVSVVAFISSEDSDLTNPDDAQAGGGGAALAVWGAFSAKTYTVGATASASSTTDNLAAGESADTTPENLADRVGAIEMGTYTLALGNLTSTDSSTISFPAGDYDTTKSIAILVIIQSRLGYKSMNFVADLVVVEQFATVNVGVVDTSINSILSIVKSVNFATDNLVKLNFTSLTSDYFFQIQDSAQDVNNFFTSDFVSGPTNNPDGSRHVVISAVSKTFGEVLTSISMRNGSGILSQVVNARFGVSLLEVFPTVTPVGVNTNSNKLLSIVKSERYSDSKQLRVHYTSADNRTIYNTSFLIQYDDNNGSADIFSPEFISTVKNTDNTYYSIITTYGHTVGDVLTILSLRTSSNSVLNEKYNARMETAF